MALPSYELSPFLNKEKLFQCTPPSSIDCKSLPSLPPEWLAELEDFCRKEKSDLKKDCFDRHLAINVKTSDRSLLNGLQLIYRRLHKDLDHLLGPFSESDRTATILKLIEGISECTKGFEERVKQFTAAFEMPNNLPQLLYQVRKGLVENVSSTQTGSIHKWNQITKVAEVQGIGINANFANDSCGEPEAKIVHALEKEFKEKYGPFNLPFLLAEQLRGLLARVGYTGPEQEGYAVGVAERIAEQIKCYLAIETVTRIDWKDFFIINEDDDFNIVIHDLNWEMIRKCFFQTLSKEGYFTQQPPEEAIHNLLDCARFSNLFSSKNHLLGIESACFNENNILQLKKIKIDFPVFWQELRLGFQHNPDLREKIPLLFSELEAAPLSVSTLEKIVLLFELDLSNLINDGSMLNSSAKLIQKKTNGCNTLMLAAGEHAEGLNLILKFIAEHPTLLDKATVQQLFLQRDSDDVNTLMLAAGKHAEGLNLILKFIAEHPTLLDKATVQQLFSQTDSNGWNALMLAAGKHSEGLNLILKFIAEHPTLLDKVTLQQMFLQKITNVQDILKEMCLVFFPAGNIFVEGAVSSQLRLTIENIGLNALNLAAGYQPDGFNAMLKFAAEHSDLFDEETLKQVMAKNTAYGWNFFIIKALLEKYLEGISDRKTQSITHTTRFSTGFFNYNFGYSTQEKEVAALKLREILETGLEESEPIKNLMDLKQSYPALSNGRLGQLCDLCCKIASDATALDKVRNIMKESREECSMILRQNP